MDVPIAARPLVWIAALLWLPVRTVGRSLVRLLQAYDAAIDVVDPVLRDWLGVHVFGPIDLRLDQLWTPIARPCSSPISRPGGSPASSRLSAARYWPACNTSAPPRAVEPFTRRCAVHAALSTVRSRPAALPLLG